MFHRERENDNFADYRLAHSNDGVIKGLSRRELIYE
jgi:hypothetical protein